VSYSLLAKVESEAAPASPAFTGPVVRAPRVDVPRITGQPYDEPGSRYAALQEVASQLRRTVLAYDLPAPADAPLRSATDLRPRVDTLRSLAQHAPLHPAVRGWAAIRCG
jgi:hypothetical protein